MTELQITWKEIPFFVRFLSIASAVASIVAIVSTVIISRNTNELHRGDNAINMIAIYGTETVRKSRVALYDPALATTVDKTAVALRYRQVAAMHGALRVVAICYQDNLCLRPTVRDYFCEDVLKYDDIFGSGAPDIARIAPDGGDVAFGVLANDCRKREANI